VNKRLIIAVLLLLLLLPCVAVVWLTYTAAGLQFALEQLNHVPKVTVVIRGVTGKLAGPLHIDYFELDHERVHVIAQQIDTDLNPALLLSGLVALNTLKVAQADVTLKHVQPGPDTAPPNFLPSFLRVSVDDVNIERVKFTSYNGFMIEATPVRAQASLSHRQVSLQQLDVQTSWLTVRGAFKLRSTTQLELDAQVAATLKPGKSAPLQSNVNMTGTAKLLNFVVSLEQPQAAQVTAALDLSQGWSLSGEAKTARWQLTPWMAKPPFSFSKVMLKFSMNEMGIHLVGDVVVPEWTPLPLHVDTQGKYAARVITLRQADVSAKQGSLSTRTTGSITFNDDALPTLDLHGSWRGLQWPLQAQPAQAYFTSANGTASLNGNLPYRFETDAELTLPRLAANIPAGADAARNSRIVASGTLTQQQVQVARYNWQVLGGTASGNAQLAFALPRTWQAAVNATDLNPGMIHTQWPGRLAINAIASGENFTPQSPFDLKLQSLAGTLRKQPIRARGHVAHAKQTWQADDVAIDWGSASLKAAGTVGPQNNLRWTFNAPALQQLYPELSGELAMNGQVMGATMQPRLALTAQSKHLAFAALQLDGLSIDTQLDLTDQSASNLQIKADQLSYGSLELQQPQLSGSGQASAHELKFTSKVNAAPLPKGLQFTLAVNGAYVDEQWQTALKQVQVIDTDKVERVHLTQEANLTVSRTLANLQAFCLNIDNGKLCASGEWHEAAAWQTHASLENLPLDLSNSAWAQDAHIRSLINAQAEFHGSSTEAWAGSAQLQLADASIRYQLVTGREQVLPITMGEAHLDADARTVRSTAQLAVGDDTTASLNAQLDRTASADWHRWSLSGRAELSSADAKLVPVFVSEVDRAAGMLTSTLRFDGTLGEPLLSGNFQLKQGELDLYRLNLALRALQLNAELNNDQLQFTAQGNAGEGLLTSSGNLGWRDNQLSGQLHLKGDKLLVADLPEYHVLASPDLTFDIAKRNVNVKGEVLIPSAKLQPKEVTGAVQTSADSRFKSDKVFARDSTWSISSNVAIRLGDDVQFDGLGLQGKLGGSVTTNLRTGNTASGRGELNVNNGVYEAYGRKLDIKRGRLIYDDTALDNPGLDIQAERKINEITVGVYVRGVLRSPWLVFYSDPTLSQTQIVSYLLVGKPLDELQSGEASSVKSASNSLALQGGGYLAAQLGRRVGLEEVGVETDTNNQQSFVLGKFLSPRLFVSYGISLTEAINTLKLRYTLSDHWTLKTEAGDAKSADVEYRIDH
jgi:translocation and assembly module TamB